MNSILTSIPPAGPALRRTERGSVLIVAILLAAIIGISLVSYINLANNSLKQADRSFYNIEAMNLAEVGLEQALYCFNQMDTVTPATAWAGWNFNNNDATRTFTGFTSGPGATGSVKVYAKNYNGSDITPLLVAQSTITPKFGPPISKYIEVTLKHRSIWAWGIVAKDSISLLSTAASVDSWNSDPTGNPANPPVLYSAAVKKDNVGIGVVSSADGALSLSSTSFIYGNALTGGGTISAASGARIYGATSPANPLIDPAHVKTDFSYTFPTITAPTPTVTNTISTSITSSATFPRVGDLTNPADGKYYYTFAAGKVIDCNGADTISINQPSVFNFPSHSGVTTIHCNGNLQVTIASTASLSIYTTGNILLESADNFNKTNPPSKLMIYGTNPTSQTFTVPGNMVLSACVYMPMGAISISGEPCDFYGAIIARSVSFTGSKFHYDEALSSLGATNPYGLTKWRELQSQADRAAYATQLNF